MLSNKGCVDGVLEWNEAGCFLWLIFSVDRRGIILKFILKLRFPTDVLIINYIRMMQRQKNAVI